MLNKLLPLLRWTDERKQLFCDIWSLATSCQPPGPGPGYRVSGSIEKMRNIADKSLFTVSSMLCAGLLDISVNISGDILQTLTINC